MRTRGLFLITLLPVFLQIGAARPQAKSGKQIFETRCVGCHALDSEKVGPRLRDIYGKPAGKIASFQYSEALKSANVTWDEATLDKWLTDTDSVVPGNEMSFRLDNAEERKAIIEYLRQIATTPRKSRAE